MRPREYSVINRRLLFTCPGCGARRSFGVQPDVRRRSVRCHKCGNITQCKLNRRWGQRESQAGKCLMLLKNGQQIDVILHDISSSGVGFDVPRYVARQISVNQQIRFKCSWNSVLFSNYRYIIRSINGSRVGAQKII